MVKILPHWVKTCRADGGSYFFGPALVINLKLFQNLRSTRQTELAESYPVHVVCAWIGNSQAVAMEHYLQVTDEHFEQAAGALQNAVQHTAAGGCEGVQGSQAEQGANASSSRLRKEAAPRTRREAAGMGDTGLEPVTSAV